MPFARLRSYFIITLIATNLALGLLSFNLLRRQGGHYAELIGQSIPILTELHKVELDVVRSYRAAALATQAATPEARLVQLALAEQLEAQSARQRQIYQTSPDLVNGTQVDRQIEAVAQVYRDRLHEYTAMVRAGRLGEANDFRTSVLRLASDDYFDVIDQRFTRLNQQAGHLSAEIGDNHTGWQKVMLTLGSWPLIAAVVFLLVMAVLVVVLLVSVFVPGLRHRTDT